MSMAVANLIHSRSPMAAAVIEPRGVVENESFESFSELVNAEVSGWALQNPLKIEARRGSCLSAQQKLDWLLKKEDIFLAEPRGRNGERNHIIGVDCKAKIAHDPLETFELPFCHDAIEACSGAESGLSWSIDIRERAKQDEQVSFGRRRWKRRRRGSKDESALDKVC